MEMNELEREIINLAGESRKEDLPKSVVPATLTTLQSGHYCYFSPLVGEERVRGVCSGA